MHLTQVHEHIDKCHEEDLALLIKLAKQPSVFVENLGLKEMADLCCELLRMIGVTPQVFQKSGAPVVFGELKCEDPNARTVLIYGHADVQPAGPLEEWDTPPWEPTLKGNRLFGRGTADNKGQFLAHVLAVRSFLATDTPLPVNVKFWFDPEEEAGSPYMPEFIEAHRDFLKADFLLRSDGTMYPGNHPLIKHGNRGGCSLELTLTTALYDNHAGNKGGVIPSASWELAKFLRSIIDDNGYCTIPGIYDDVAPISDYNKMLISKLEYDPAALAKTFGVKEIKLSQEEFYKRIMFLPHFNLSGLSCTGASGGVPGSASCKLHISLVNDQEPTKIFNIIKEHCEKIRDDITLKFVRGREPSLSDPEHELNKAVARGVATAHGMEPFIQARSGAGGPSYLFINVLGLPYANISYGNADQNNHAANENIDLDCFYRGIHCTTEILWEIANAPACQ